MRPDVPGTLLAAAALAALAAAPASAEQQVIEVQVNDKVPAGKAPSLVIHVNKDLKTLTVELLRDDGEEIRREDARVPRGSKRTYDLPASPGVFHYHGTIQVTLTSGESGSMNVDFGTEVVAGLGLAVDRGDLNLDACTLKLKSNRALARVDYVVTGEDGSMLGRGELTLPPSKPPYTVDWKQREGPVLKLKLTATDTAGIHEDLELIPWSWSIPHEEVEFESGKSEIRPGETPKLDRSYALLQEGLDKYGKHLPVKLYIAGHTDTVAPAEYNHTLSEARAMSIARFFRLKGFTHPIFYQGFGERALKLQTPDNTDEPRNRRAEYVLAAEPPPVDVPGAASGWKKLEVVK